MILWFSGTGNSRYVAEKLASILNESLREITPEILNEPIKSSKSSRVIWVFPVYSWGVPPYILRTINDIQFDEKYADMPHHLVVTCGDDTGLTADMWRNAIRKRKWRCGSAFSVQMPNNYVCMSGFDVDPAPVEEAKLKAAPIRISKIAETILKNETDLKYVTDMVTGRFAWIKSKIIYPWFIRYAMSPKPFHHTNNCISCGKCAAICPLKNITMTTKTSSEISLKIRRHPLWGENCAGCLACYHVCPKHAVEYGNKTTNKGQYLNPILRSNKK